MGIRLPLGKDNFAGIRDGNFYYIDKTGLIKELLDKEFEANLITRPRRFGKTLMMTMLEDFFDISRDSKAHFKGLKVSGDRELCREWMNQWPVIFLTLKRVEGNDFDTAFRRFKVLVSEICKAYAFLGSSEKVDVDDRALFKSLKAQESDPENLTNCLNLLTRMMAAHYGKPAILLIDEYDVPLAKADEKDYYAEMLDVIRDLFSVLKTNTNLKFAVVAGCLRIAKESIFTGTNHFVSDTILDGRFHEYIGFTQADVDEILGDTGLSGYAGRMRRWYDGYRFGAVDIYCPWDVLNYTNDLMDDPGARPKNYWENTSHNGIIRQFIDRRDLWEGEQINLDMEKLIAGEGIEKAVTMELTYDTAHSSAENLWGLLFMTGYLTLDMPGESGAGPDGGVSSQDVRLRIPNEEVRSIFQTTVRAWFRDSVKATDRSELFAALWGQDAAKCASLLSDLVFNTISCYDYKEDFYHAFVAGILSYAGYRVESNREQREGRPDVVVKDDRRARVAIIEVKHALEPGRMEAKCDEALEQIRARRYDESLGNDYDDIICYGVSFYKKRCSVKVEKYK